MVNEYQLNELKEKVFDAVTDTFMSSEEISNNITDLNSCGVSTIICILYEEKRIVRKSVRDIKRGGLMYKYKKRESNEENYN